MADDQYLIEIRSDISDLQRDLRTLQRDVRQTTDRMDRQFRQSSQRMSAAMSGAFAAARTAAVALGAAVAASVALSVREASSAQEIRSKFNAVFRGAAGDVRAWAEQMAQSVNRSSVDLESYLATFQDTFVPMGIARDEAATLSQSLTQLAVDLASFNNANEPETVALLASALVGNHEAVRRFGVVITAATLNQELMNMGIREGAQEATQAQLAQARLNIIMRSTSDAQGDAARTSESFANQMRGTQASLRDAGEAIGTEFLPAATQMLEWLQEIMPAIQSFGETMGQVASDMAAVFEASRDGELISPRDVEHAERLLEDVQELQRVLLNMPADSLVGIRGSQIRQVLGAENLEREGILTGSQARLSASDIQRLLQMTSMRIDELTANRVVIPGSGGDGTGGAGSGGDGGGTVGASGPLMGPPTLDSDPIEEFQREWEEGEEAFDQLKDKTREANEEIKLAALAAQELGAHGEQAAKAFEDAFVRAIETGRLEVEDLGRQILRIFAQMAYQETFEGPIRNLIRGAFSFGGGVGKKASGGPGSGLTLVGEQGPELVNLGDHANVMTANLTRMAMRNAKAGGGVNSNSVSQSFVIDARGADMGVEERLRQVLAEQAPAIQQRATVGALEAMNAIQKRQRAV